MFCDEAKELEIGAVFRRSFGIDLILDRTRKEGVFHICRRSDLPPHNARPTPEFKSFMAKLSTLRQQGDGMRSFARILIEIGVRNVSILAIDEPELFLHPPQIRQLAGVIASEKSEHAQVFIATHSNEFVKGILDRQPADVNFIRLTREGGATGVSFLQHENVKALWSDPLLRTSNALSSFSHQFTIACEGETDVRFLRWALDEHMREDQSIDYFVTHCGGNQKMGTITKAIRSIGANVLSVRDIDILNDKANFKRLVESHGGDYSKFEPHQRLILTRVSERRTELSGHYFWSEMDALKQKFPPGPSLSSSLAGEVSALVRRSSPRGRIKEDGERAFVDAESINAFTQIADSAEELGIFINREGELESLCRSIPRNSKVAWLNQVLGLKLGEAVELTSARHFISRIESFMREKYLANL